MFLRPADESDRVFLIDLEKRVMYDHAVAIFGQWHETNPCSINVSSYEVVQVVDSDGHMEAAGYVATCIDNEAFFIEKLYLEPHHQGRGLGAAILSAMKVRASDAGRRLELSVLTTNPALAFYRREGLIEVARTAERIRMRWESGTQSE